MNKFEEFHKNCKGVFEIRVIDRRDVQQILYRKPWEPCAIAIFSGMAELLTKIERASRGRKPLCATCDSELTSGSKVAAFAAITPFAGSTTAMVGGVCSQCLYSPDLQERVMACLRKGWTNLRVMMEVGHA